MDGLRSLRAGKEMEVKGSESFWIPPTPTPGCRASQ